MKKQIAAFGLCLCTCFPMPSYGQKSFTADVPCKDSLILSLKGKYREEPDGRGMEYFSRSLAPADVTQLKSRLKAISQMVEETIPPLGLEPFWKLMGGNYRFAQDAQNEKGIATLSATYLNYIQYYSCSEDNSNFVSYSGETGTLLQISFNGIHAPMEFNSNNNFLVDGRPVYQSRPVVGKWKGYDLYASCELEVCRDHYVLLHRPGTNPYLPVTRKQYLDLCFAWLRQLYDPMIEDIKKNDPDNLGNTIKNRDEILNKYKEELAKSAKEGLLDSPAIVREVGNVLPDQPVFSTAEEGGGKLVTQNPAYFRKDLPRYVPQLIWVRWSWNDSAATLNFKKVLEESFPIEKLQALIDK